MFKVSPIPTFQDNYVWLIQQTDGNEVWVVDPGDATAVIEYLEKHKLELVGVLITHSHYDHIGGLDDILRYKNVAILGPDSQHIPQITHPLYDDDKFSLWGTNCTAYAAPGHMPEHLCYVVESNDNYQLFSGDVLFSSGCGRIFSGTHLELKSSLDRLKQLPENTLVYSAHEYTQANIAFAKAVEPNNPALLEREQSVIQMRAQGQPSLPTTIALETQVNPFLRCNNSAVVDMAKQHIGHSLADELEVFTALRQWKDNF
ncbi:hydroxyacylglutathione hydrolase [Agarilytica rhodophyticola]|uniref:hydroxyacylglutathione hydrolase n=1 Tax=Agarilytica rhodophyticola TaxID=1737490 RepID=UPI000B342729|nr:hydroxyacylglutathione hydrolase [Agarilytica rhodophyticola]